MKHDLLTILLALQNVEFFDTETTGIPKGFPKLKGEFQFFNPEVKAAIIEIATMSFNKKGYEGFYEDIIYNDEVLIDPAAASVHTISNSMVRNPDLPVFTESSTVKKIKKAIDKGSYIVAHNLPFDLNMLNIEGMDIPVKQRIDTLQVAKHLYKDGLLGLESSKYYSHYEGTVPELHKLQYFRFLFEMDDQEYFKEAMKIANLDVIKPHSALSDVFILTLLLAKMMSDFNLALEDMVTLSNTPIVHDFKWTIGKWRYRGMTLSEIIAFEDEQWGKPSPGYKAFDWALNTMPHSPDMLLSIDHFLAQGLIKGTIPKHLYKKNLRTAIAHTLTKDEIEKALPIYFGKEIEDFKESFLEVFKSEFTEDLAYLNKDVLSQEEGIKNNSEYNADYIISRRAKRSLSQRGSMLTNRKNIFG